MFNENRYKSKFHPFRFSVYINFTQLSESDGTNPFIKSLLSGVQTLTGVPDGVSRRKREKGETRDSGVDLINPSFSSLSDFTDLGDLQGNTSMDSEGKEYSGKIFSEDYKTDSLGLGEQLKIWTYKPTCTL